MQSLLSACEEVLLRQLGSWLIYGSNVDPHLDWFVRGTGDEDGGLNQAARTKDTSKWYAAD